MLYSPTAEVTGISLWKRLMLRQALSLTLRLLQFTCLQWLPCLKHSVTASPLSTFKSADPPKHKLYHRQPSQRHLTMASLPTNNRTATSTHTLISVVSAVRQWNQRRPVAHALSMASTPSSLFEYNVSAELRLTKSRLFLRSSLRFVAHFPTAVSYIWRSFQVCFFTVRRFCRAVEYIPTAPPPNLSLLTLRCHH